MLLNAGYHCDLRLVSTGYFILVNNIYTRVTLKENMLLNAGYHCDPKLVSTVHILVNIIYSQETLKGKHAA